MMSFGTIALAIFVLIMVFLILKNALILRRFARRKRDWAWLMFVFTGKTKIYHHVDTAELAADRQLTLSVMYALIAIALLIAINAPLFSK